MRMPNKKRNLIVTELVLGKIKTSNRYQLCVIIIIIKAKMVFSSYTGIKDS